MNTNTEQGFAIGPVIGIIAVIALGGALLFGGGSTPTEVSEDSENVSKGVLREGEHRMPDGTIMKNDNAASGDEKMMDGEMDHEGMDGSGDESDGEDMDMNEAAIINKEPIATKGIDGKSLIEAVTGGVGTFEAYGSEKLTLAENGDVVLFFHAPWCPGCRGLEADINKNLSAIPENTHILKLDFDTETELRKKHGVTTQHTLVQVDAAGEKIAKWSGSNSLDALLAKVE
jgi:thiol-disulfide isomerase/thioredoxin